MDIPAGRVWFTNHWSSGYQAARLGQTLFTVSNLRAFFGWTSICITSTWFLYKYLSMVAKSMSHQLHLLDESWSAFYFPRVSSLLAGNCLNPSISMYQLSGFNMWNDPGSVLAASWWRCPILIMIPCRMTVVMFHPKVARPVATSCWKCLAEDRTMAHFKWWWMRIQYPFPRECCSISSISSFLLAGGIKVQLYRDDIGKPSVAADPRAHRF